MPDPATPPNGLVPPTVDPIVAALVAAGFPVQGQNPVTGTPASDNQDQGPVISPEQVAGTQPSAPVPTTPATSPPDAAYAPPVGSPVTAPAQTSAGPQNNPPAVGPALRPGDVMGAAKEQNAALQGQTGNIQDAELAKIDALAAHADKRAQIYDGHSQAQALIDQQYQVAREHARSDANAETAAWMRDVDKKVAEEPVPGRWWANQTKFGQVMYLASLAFGSMAQAKNPNLKNIALEMITKETESDIAEQRDRIKRQVDTLKMKGQVIDQKLQAQLSDSKDDHGLLVSRLAMVQQAALERANAPGSADTRAAMAEASQWAGQQRLTIAGERANRAYAEREGQLGRDAENARAMLVDKRDRDIAAATIQKDYDLANIKASAKDDVRIKDSVVLPPETTGIRVVNEAGQPVATPLGNDGGMVVSKANEKSARQLSEMASMKYAAMKRVSAALGQDGNFTLLAKRDPGLVSDIVQLGYQGVRGELAPGDRVTDADFVAGLEHELGGDLSSLSGRIASSTFSAGKDEIKKLVDKHLRDYQKNVGHQLGSLLDGAIPGYQGKIRADWTPKSVETDVPANPSSQQIDASYGIKTPIKAPQSVEELSAAQALEKRGLEALPPYQPGSQDKVQKALEDFKGAMPDTIDARGRAITDTLYKTGDQRAVLEVQQAKYAEMKRSKERLDEVDRALRIITHTDQGLDGRKYLEDEESRVQDKLSNRERAALGDERAVPPHLVVDIAKAHGITQLSGQDVLDIIKKTGLKPYTE